MGTQHRGTLRSLRRLLAITALAALGIFISAGGASAATPKALINAATVSGGASSVEATIAAAQGFAVTVVSDATWGGYTATDFGGYDLLIAGDPTCGSLPPGLVSSFFAVHLIHDLQHSPLDRSEFLASLVLLGLLVRRRMWQWFWLALPLVIVPAVTQGFCVFGRYALVAFPLFVAAGIASDRPEREPVFTIVAAISLALQTLLAVMHASSYWGS